MEVFIESWIRESNLIEAVDDPAEDARSLRAWDWFKGRDLTESAILSLHGRIMLKKLPRRERGAFRRCGVMVGGRVCPPWEEVPKLHGMWFLAWGDANTAEKIKVAHIQWEKIHPFVDGNGRTGRMIMNWQRVKAGLEPLTIMYAKRGDYYGWFR